MTHLDMFDIYRGKISELVEDMVSKINNNNPPEENYKYISNLYEIFTILKNKYNLYENNKDYIKKCSDGLDSKSRFKIMDIMDIMDLSEQI